MERIQRDHDEMVELLLTTNSKVQVSPGELTVPDTELPLARLLRLLAAIVVIGGLKRGLQP